MTNKIYQTTVLVLCATVMCIVIGLAVCRVATKEGDSWWPFGLEKLFAKDSSQQQRELQEDSTPNCYEGFLSDGTRYHIQARHSGKVLTVQNNALTNGASVVQATLNVNNLSQQWHFATHAPGPEVYYYNVWSAESGLLLNVEGGSTDDRANVIQWPFQDYVEPFNDHWCFKRVLDGNVDYFTIIARHSNKAVDIDGASTAEGASAIQYTQKPTEMENQQFRIVPVGTLSTPLSACGAAYVAQVSELNARIADLEAALLKSTPPTITPTSSYSPTRMGDRACSIANIWGPNRISLQTPFDQANYTVNTFLSGGTYLWQSDDVATIIYGDVTGRSVTVNALASSEEAGGPSPIVVSYTLEGTTCTSTILVETGDCYFVSEIQGPSFISLESGLDIQNYSAQAFFNSGSYSWTIGGGAILYTDVGATVSVGAIVPGNAELVVTYTTTSEVQPCTTSTSKTIKILSTDCYFASDIQGPDSIDAKPDGTSHNYTVQGVPAGGSYHWALANSGNSHVFLREFEDAVAHVEAHGLITFEYPPQPRKPGELVVTYTVNENACSISKFIGSHVP